MKLLLHICCAPCSVACIKYLKEYSSMIDLKVIYNDYYGLREFVSNVVDKLDNRCGYCYTSRLETVVKYAKENGYDAFSTTLFISPYQRHDLLKSICKKMFKETGLYMQKYCGCVFSEEERYNKNIKNNYK